RLSQNVLVPDVLSDRKPALWAFGTGVVIHRAGRGPGRRFRRGRSRIGSASGTRQGNPAISTTRLCNQNFDRAITAIVGFVRWVVTDHILRAQVADNLVRYLRQLGN